jgi:signal transduction histidine kinase
MKPRTFEPGLFRAIKLLALIQVFGVLFIRRPIGAAMGLEVTLARWIGLTLSGPLFLVAYTWIPWWRNRLGRLYMPLLIATASINVILEKYLTLSWLIPPGQRELATLLLMVKTWLDIQFVTLLVAWVYSRGSVFWTSLGLCITDGVLSLPFMTPGGSLYPLTLVLFFTRVLSVTLVAVGVQWLVDRQRQQRQALVQANQKLAQYAATVEQLAVSRERIRLARELHDTLAHSLSGVTVQLEAVQALWEVNAGEARRMLAQALRSARTGLTEARRALHSLRASPLEDLGLSLALSDLAQSVAARANLGLELDVENHLENIPSQVEQSVYRVAQEALSNVARHARATSLRVALLPQDGRLVLTVADDGCGFDTSTVHATHYGIKGLRERAELVGGTLDVDSSPHKGTTVRLTISPGLWRVER